MKIGIMGASCSGKSTLLKALYEKYPHYCFIEEIASNYTPEQRAVFSFQRDILRQQISAELDMLPLISDRTVLDNLAYCMWYYREHNYSEPEIYLECVQRIDKHLREAPYDVIFFVDEYFELEDNGIRLVDNEQQAETYRMLRGIASVYCATYKIPFYFISGMTHERIIAIESVITL
jgi:nicotinamide riboside kinase